MSGRRDKGDMGRAAYLARGGFAISKADADLAQPAYGLWVGTAGDVKVTFEDGSTDTIPSVPAGIMLPIVAVRVWSTGTTASGFFGFKLPT